MKHLVISDQATYAPGLTITEDVDTIESLTAGGLVFVNALTGHFINPGVAAYVDYPFYCVAGYAEGNRVSPIFNQLKFEYEKTVYVAPVAAITGWAGTAGAVTVGKSYSLQLIDLNNEHFEYQGPIYSHVAIAGDTAAIITAALVAQINADANAPCTAVLATTDDFTFTGKAASPNFAVVNMGGIYEGYTSTYSTPYVSGQGTPAQILELEKETNPREGHNNTVGWETELWNVSSKVGSASTYTFYKLKWTNEEEEVMLNEDHSPMEHYIVVLSGSSALISDLDEILAAVGKTAPTIMAV